ncbi:uncharacterized protein [Triticum aestivum]|uniref:uncharacterized protein isoform X3 n=1 Tax=Triticum aestivum TaxID=4565 RepID=UPI001D001FB2|nr:uncharacterized protein LOC123161382 isoform X3 [Triticum aestivum]
MPLPTSTAAGGGRRCLLLRAVPVGYHRYPTTRSTAASVHGYPCSAYFVEDVLQAALPGKKTYSMGNLSMEKKNPVQGITDACGRLVQGMRWTRVPGQALSPRHRRSRGRGGRAGTGAGSISWALAILQDGCHAVSDNNRRWRSCREAMERRDLRAGGVGMVVPILLSW